MNRSAWLRSLTHDSIAGFAAKMSGRDERPGVFEVISEDGNGREFVRCVTDYVDENSWEGRVFESFAIHAQGH